MVCFYAKSAPTITTKLLSYF
ncbi:hypothetical protein XFF6166_880034 [Xanthomonas citri pv. fuscans]|nr:hypothetical protein XFF6166_880034 [Xanthomonas citri pv. fuscans]SOO04388.1 hypothetical protein XFF6960_970034 [Xanthomonas citri pv. fuscans]SOO07488.1 hypothetical protein XFF7767_970064 [Xanthomonas citri pv. fuscans]SOO08087.1 hypothetical protein XFF6970_150030 [Xanthomonas citri pv. fuscans]SOO13454.1 hypothetical protein XFF7766_180027 [Xanthomonas citri pv. fuscans]